MAIRRGRSRGPGSLTGITHRWVKTCPDRRDSLGYGTVPGLSRQVERRRGQVSTTNTAGPAPAESQEQKFLSVRQAAFIGVGAMVGAGIFALLGAAGEVAGAAV